MSFRDWLIVSGKNAKTVSSICSRINRLKKEYLIEYEYEKDHCRSMLEDLTSNHSSGNKPNMNISGDYITGLRSLHQALVLYVEYLDTKETVINVENITTPTGLFEGSFGMFNRFTGPTWCKKVQLLSRVCKRKVDICECCLQKKELHAAHKRKLSRLDIIKNILDTNYLVSPDFYRVDLIDFERKFVNAHKPVEDTFYFLCSDCHKKYDSENTAESGMIVDLIVRNKAKL